MRREKSAFDHINTDWNLPHDDGSTDFSDDDTMMDDRVSIFSQRILQPCSSFLGDAGFWEFLN